MCTAQQLAPQIGVAQLNSPSILELMNGDATYGTYLTSVTIKATGNTAEGMIRFYISSGGMDYLIQEVWIPASSYSGTSPTF